MLVNIDWPKRIVHFLMAWRLLFYVLGGLWHFFHLIWGYTFIPSQV